MKYIKLFEEFKVEYNLIKDFPPAGCCKCADVQEADALCDMLEKAKYVSGNQHKIERFGAIHNLQDIEWKAKRLTVVWNSNRKYFRMDEDPSMFDSSYKEIEFDDYFEAEEKYKGHQIGKKYGI
jgi:hypothetical protein